MKTFGNAVRHRWRPAAAIVAIFVVLAAVLVAVKPRTYDASAQLFVDERHNSSQGFDLALQAAELMSHHYLEMATTRQVIEGACSGPDAGTIPPGTPCGVNELAGKVRADTVRGTSMIAVKVSARSPAAASALANAIANSLVAQDRRQVAELLAPTKDYLDGELQRLNTAVKAEQAALPAGITTSPTLARLQEQYAATFTKRQDLAVEEFRLGGSLSVVEPALPPTKPADPDPVRYLLVGLVAGLAAALVVALLLEYFDDRLREPDDLAQAAGTPLVVAANGHAASYALAHASLLAVKPRLGSVLVAGSSAHDHAEVAARGLAAAATEGGQRAVVVGGLAEATKPLGPDDLRVIAAPSPDVSSRALSLAGSAGLAVVVATAGKTRFGEARRTADLLRHAGVEVAVGILLPRDPKGGANGREPAR